MSRITHGLAPVTALGLVLLVAAPADANSFSVSTTGSKASWTDAGNLITSEDTAPDGYSSVAQLRRPNGNISTFTNSNGYPSYTTWAPSVAEDRTIEIRACKSDAGGAPFGCSVWESGSS